MISIKRASSAENVGGKLFGEAFMPEKWLENDEFSIGEVFFCQIDLEKIKAFDKDGLLPDKGFLYFFIDFDENPAKGVVRYSETADALTPFNEECELFYDVETEVPLELRSGESENGLLAYDKKLLDNEVCLLKFTPNTLDGVDFLSDVDGSLLFVIDKEALKKRRFDKAVLINV